MCRLLVLLACLLLLTTNTEAQMATASASRVQSLQQRKLAIQQQRVELKKQHVIEQRIANYARDPFMEYRLRYLSHRMMSKGNPKKGTRSRFIPPAWFHHEMSRQLVMLATGQSAADHFTGAFSRAFGKSTQGTEDFTLWAICEGYYRNVVIVGASSQEKEYQTRLRNITQELETNEALRRDYPGILPAKDQKGQQVKWTDAEIICANGCRVACMPYGGNIRGQSYNTQRPDLIIFDDPEKRRDARSPAWLKEAKRWFEEDVLGSEGAEGVDIIWNGTYLSYDCLLLWLHLPEAVEDEHGEIPEGRFGKGWSGPDGVPLVVPMINDEGESNWPDYFPLEKVERIQRKMGPRGFAIERQLKVQEESDKIFTEELLLQQSENRDHRTGLVETSRGYWELRGEGLSVYSHCDPSSGEEVAKGKKDEKDYGVIATVGIDRNENLYLLDLERGRFPYHLLVKKIKESHDHWHPLRFGIEANAVQSWLKQGVLKSRTLPVVPITSTKSKYERIESFSLNLHNRKFWFDRRQGHQESFYAEGILYPLSEHDDVLDSVAQACELALEHKYKGPSSSRPEALGSRRHDYDDFSERGDLGGFIE